MSPGKAITLCIRAIAHRAAPAAAFAVLVALSNCASPPRPQLSAADVADVDRITAYLNSIPRFEAHFIQFGAFGQDTGLIWLDRPDGRLRIDSAQADGRLTLIADGQVLILDRSNGSTTTMPVSRTPLGMLLTPQISLSGAVTVANIVHQPGMVQVMLEKTDDPSQGSLTLTLADPPLQLVGVTVTDVHRRTLTMHLYNIDPHPALTPALFQPPAEAPRS